MQRITSQGPPEAGSKPPEARGEAWDTLSLSTSEGTHPADTWVLGLQPLELRDNTFLLLEPPSLWPLVTAALAN